MNADQVIENIRALSKPEELEKVGQALEEHRAELADRDAAKRIDELRTGKVKALSQEEVFQSVRKRVRES